MKFEELNLSQDVLKGIEEIGFEEMSPIQANAIPKLLEKKDIIGQAQTGTGKTATFGIPIIENTNVSENTLQGIILCPTRELSIQVAEEIGKLSKFKKGFKILPVYGGVSIERQLRALKKGVHLVVGTPGRVMDHMRRKSLTFENVKFLVLDEADEMFDMGFREDMEFIIEKTPEDRQTAFFSATMEKEIRKFSEKYQSDPEIVKIEHKELTVSNINQYYLELKQDMKTEILSRIIDIKNPKLTIVFCNTKRKVDELTAELQSRGYFADGLHGDLKQNSRDTVMRKFREGTIDILVATDVAARGLDVDDIDLVINYDLPQDEEYYVHRIGRTARAGRKGTSYTFVVGRDVYKLRDIQKYTKADIEYKELPTLKDIKSIYENKLIEQIKNEIEKSDLGKYKSIIDSLLIEEYSSVDIAAALLRLQSENKNLSGHKELDMVDYGRKFTRQGDFKDKGKGSVKGGKKRGPRIFINKGRIDGIGKRNILAAIATETTVPKKVLGDILIFDKFSFVEMPSDFLKRCVKQLDGKKIKGKKVSVEISTGR